MSLALATAARVLHAGILVEMDFPTGVLRLWTGQVPITTTDGRVWGRAGGLGLVSLPPRTDRLEAAQCTVGLRFPETGADYAAVAAAARADRQADIRGRDLSIYLQFFDADMAQVGAPQAEFVGVMSTIRTTRSYGALEVTLTGETDRVRDLSGAYGRYTSADQRARYPGDAGLDLVPANAVGARAIIWPRD